jgi:hypothetical protein
MRCCVINSRSGKSLWFDIHPLFTLQGAFALDFKHSCSTLCWHALEL